MPYADKEKQRAYHREYQQRPKRKAYKRAWLDQNPDKQAEYIKRQRARIEADPEKYRTYFRNRHIIKTYGITPERYAEMVAEQGGVCAVCGRLPNGTNHVEQNLVIDHRDDSGKVRGLLCNNCNSGMGMIGDTVAHLEAAMEYLKKYGGG